MCSNAERVLQTKRYRMELVKQKEEKKRKRNEAEINAKQNDEEIARKRKT